MALNVVPCQPAFGTPLNGRPISRGLVCAIIFNGGTAYHDSANVARDFFYFSSLTSTAQGVNKWGRYLELTSAGTSEAIISANSRSEWVPASNVTVSICYQKSDGTNRASQLCGVDVGLSGAAYYMNMHVPYSDGVVYWDLGGTGGANRCSVGGLTFGADHFVFTSGTRGMEIWQNGILRASNANNPTRSVDVTHPYKFGGMNTQISDLVKLNMHCMWKRQLSLREIYELNTDPYAPWRAPR